MRVGARVHFSIDVVRTPVSAASHHGATRPRAAGRPGQQQGSGKGGDASGLVYIEYMLKSEAGSERTCAGVQNATNRLHVNRYIPCMQCAHGGRVMPPAATRMQLHRLLAEGDRVKTWDDSWEDSCCCCLCTCVRVQEAEQLAGAYSQEAARRAEQVASLQVGRADARAPNPLSIRHVPFGHEARTALQDYDGAADLRLTSCVYAWFDLRPAVYTAGNLHAAAVLPQLAPMPPWLLLTAMPA